MASLLHRRLGRRQLSTLSRDCAHCARQRQPGASLTRRLPIAFDFLLSAALARLHDMSPWLRNGALARGLARLRAHGGPGVLLVFPR